MVTCPGCCENRYLGPQIQVGDILTCDACAGGRFRLVQDHGVYVLRVVPEASCPQCDAVVQLSDTVQPGHIVRHCDGEFVVTYAYGAYALESATTGPYASC
jgi:hypothetical protein